MIDRVIEFPAGNRFLILATGSVGFIFFQVRPSVADNRVWDGFAV
jgi:hypothetical protein